jgi:hypothetical protein
MINFTQCVYNNRKGESQMGNSNPVNQNSGVAIIRTQELVASMNDAWNIISTPGNLTKWHPFCLENTVVKWMGTGSNDIILYYSGLRVERVFTGWWEGSGYDLTATSEDGLKYDVSWRLADAGNQHSKLTLTIRPYPHERTEQYARFLEKYIEQALAGLEFFVRTGELVKRNQFGSHRLFSPPVNSK